MWVFTNKGFISIIQSMLQPGLLEVRGRARRHLETLFPGKQVVYTPERDYSYRVFVTMEETVAVMVRETEAIKYTNFKKSVLDDRYHDTCMDVWCAVHKGLFEPRRSQIYSGNLIMSDGLHVASRIAPRKKGKKVRKGNMEKLLWQYTIYFAGGAPTHGSIMATSKVQATIDLEIQYPDASRIKVWY
jgi:hypothetical protein